MKLSHIKTGIIACSALACVTLMSQAAMAKPVEIKFSHVVAENTPKGQMANKFKDLIKERLGDEKAIVKVYPNKQLYGDGKVLEAMLLGDVEIAAPSLSKFKKYTKKLQLFDLPFLFKDSGAAARFLQSPDGTSLLSSLDSKGFVGLGYLNNGMKQLSSTKKMVVPSDASGLKFRIMNSDVLQAQFEAVSATPLKKPFSEVFTLLQTKAIDGQENTWSNIYSKKFYEVQPFIMESNHGYLGYLVVTSSEFWNNLPEDIRGVVKTSLDEGIAFGNKIADEKAVSDRQAIADSGKSEVYTISAEERQQWVDIMKPVWKKFEAEVGADLIQAAANQK